MTPLPKRKHTRSRSGKRRNSPAGKLAVPNLTICPSCKKLKWPHKVCRYCGYYKS